MKVIRAIYENGIFKPLEKVNLKERTVVLLRIEIDKREIVEKYAGILGEADEKELKEIEQEAQLQ